MYENMFLNEYRDRISYVEEVVEVAWRRGSLEVNSASSTVKGVRIYRNGYWTIRSVQSGEASWKVLEEEAEKLVARRHPTSTKGFLLRGEECRGYSRLGENTSLDDVLELVEYIVERIRGGEVVVLVENIRREIVSDYSSCSEEKTIYEVNVFVEEAVGSTRSVGSAGIAFTGTVKDTWRIVNSLIEDSLRRSKAGLRARKLGVLETGRWTIILDYEASGAFFHEIAHLLEGDQPEHLGLNQRISTIGINLYDDPYYPWSPATRTFDDEGVRSTRKPLVEDGEVVGLLHTRESAAKTVLEGLEASPGQARGLFHKPKAMHTTLIVGSGDWRFKELLEETRKAILVDGIVRAELSGQTITIIPETAWLVEREVKEPVRIRAIRFPLIRALTTIDAVTRTSRLRYSYEKGHIVAEIAPSIRLQGIVEA